MSIPLYDDLLKFVRRKDLKACEKNEFISEVKKFDKTGLELLYVLIKKDYITHRADTEGSILPYKGVYTNKNDLKFSLADMPIRLRHILYNFMKKHRQKMEEEKLHTKTDV
jgi:hypothetical protein